MSIIVIIASFALFISSLAIFTWSIRHELNMRLQGRLPERLIWRKENYILIVILFLLTLLVYFIILRFFARELFQLALFMSGLGPFVVAFAVTDLYWGIKRKAFVKLWPSIPVTTMKKLEDTTFLIMLLIGGFLFMTGLNLLGHWVNVAYFPLK